MKLSVHLVSWNGSKYVPYLFDSLRQQTFRDWELLVIDNNSTDDTVAAIQKELVNFPVGSRVIVNKANRGFAGGHNQALGETKSEFVLMLNQDMFVAPDCLEKLISFLDTHPEAAAVAPRLMRWDFKNNIRTNYIDALGLKIFRSCRVVEQGAGQEWKSKNIHFIEVFGVSGAFPLFRRSALDQILFADGTLFDEVYFMYKEDVDMAYRLAQAGFKSYVVPGAVAWHDRTAAGPHELTDLAAAKNKKTHNKTVRYYSYRNHLMTLYKNEYWQNFILDFPWIVWYELKKFLYFLLFDRSVLRGLGEIWKMRKDLKAKKFQIKNSRKIDWREMRKFWS